MWQIGSYERALKKAKFAWQDCCEDGILFSVSSYDYKMEADSSSIPGLRGRKYNNALEAARTVWRYTCEDGSDVGIDPDDYETEEAYNEALEDIRQAVVELSCANISVSTIDDSGKDEAALPKELDYSTRRGYDAALELTTMNDFPGLYSDADSNRHRNTCEPILNGKELPFKYLLSYQPLQFEQSNIFDSCLINRLCKNSPVNLSNRGLL